MIAPCKFQLRVLSSNETILENGIAYQFYMEKQDAGIFKFTLP